MEEQTPNKTEDSSRHTKGSRLAAKEPKIKLPKLSKKTKGPKEPKAKPTKWKLSKKERLLWVLPAIAIVVLVSISYQVGHYFTDYTLEQDGFQYYGGGAFYFREGTVFRHENDQTDIIEGDVRSNMSALPIYLSDDSLFLPCDMVYWDVTQTFQTRIEYYTQLSMDKYGQIAFTREDSTKTVTGGFLYDGGDFYMFLEPVTLKFNSYEISLSAFSYVEVSATGDLMLYDYHWDEFYMDTPRTSVVAISETGSYTISLVGDTVQAANDGSRMLASRPTDLDCLFE